MVGVLPGHDRFVEYRLAADIATIRTVCTYRRTIRQKEQVCVRSDLVVALRAFEAINVEK